MRIKKSYALASSILLASLLSGILIAIFGFVNDELVPMYSSAQDFWSIFFRIFIKNFLIIIFMLIISLIPYLPALLLSVYNFIVFGASLGFSIMDVGMWGSLLRYLHGLLEIPVIIIGLALSLRFSHFICAKIWGKSGKATFHLKKMEIILTPLLLLAAGIIETIYIKEGL
ncbi:hypothetical protein GHK52_04505 [Lactococcus garvieae]|nr:hypothetical protein [Lactococcus garvieae]